MNLFKKAQKLSISWKRIIVVILVIIIGVPLAFLIARNFQRRIEDFNKESFLDDSGFTEIKARINDLSEQINSATSTN